MDTAYMARVTLSALIFAPGAILLCVFAFVGLLQAAERTGLFNWYVQRVRTAEAVVSMQANPAAGEAVSGLDRALGEAEATMEGKDKKVVNLP